MYKKALLIDYAACLQFSGDADFVCNWIGNQLVAEAVPYPGQAAFKAQELRNYSVDGIVSGTFK